MSTSDRPMVGSTAGGGLDEETGFFPFSLLVGAIAMEGTELRSDWKQEQRFGGRKGNRKHVCSEEGITV